MPTPTGRARPGDIYAVPLGGSSSGVLNVTWTARQYENAISSRVVPELRHASILALDDSHHFDKALLYSAQACAQSEWLFLRSEPLSPEETGYSLRLVAGNVYLEDTLLRKESPEDRRHLRNMAVAGCGAVINILRDLFSAEPSHPERWRPPSVRPPG